jgi:protein-S-isoprenylcysteine O-methyltransferase Ste14
VPPVSGGRLGLSPGSQERLRSLFPTLAKWHDDPALAVDCLARVGVFLWFGTAAARIVPSLAEAASAAATQGGVAALWLAAKLSLCAFCTLIVWMTMMRARPVAKLGGLRPRLEAAFGTFLVYALPMFPPALLGPALIAISTALIGGGTAAAVVILFRLGRSFSIMPEARKLVTTGPYRVVRHPHYLAELVATFGTFLQFASLATALLLSIQVAFQVRRMLNEETVLRRIFPGYDTYARNTARLLPGIW